MLRPRGRGLGMACSHYVSGSAKPVHWSGEPHAVINRSATAARYLEIGNRIEGDNAFYPDDDLLWVETEGGTIAAHKDGRRYE